MQIKSSITLMIAVKSGNLRRNFSFIYNYFLLCTSQLQGSPCIFKGNYRRIAVLL